MARKRRSEPAITPPQGTGAGGGDARDAKDLREEIQALREVLRRLNEQARNELELKDLIRATDVIGRASARLANLLKAQAALGGGKGPGTLTRALELALGEMEKDNDG